MTKNLFFRVCVYIAGLLLLAFGVAISINSGLGVSPVNSLPFVLAQVSGMGLGTCVTLVFSVYILIQALILRKNFRSIDLTQIIFSTLFGYFVDFAKSVLGGWVIPTYAGKLLMLALSIIVIATGISLYVGAQLVNMPMEGLTSAIVSMKSGRSFPQIKVIVDIIVVMLAAGISLLCQGKIHGVREGTVLCAVLVGPTMKLISKPLELFLKKLHA